MAIIKQLKNIVESGSKEFKTLYLVMIVSKGYSARSWAKETGKNSGKEQIFNSC